MKTPTPVLLIVSGATLAGTYFTSYKDQPVLKHCLWLAFMSQISMLLTCAVTIASAPAIIDAFYATGFTMGGLGLIAYNAPSE